MVSEHDPRRDHGYNARTSDRSYPRTPKGKPVPEYVVRKAIPAVSGTPWHVRKLCQDCTRIYRQPVWKMHTTHKTFDAAMLSISNELNRKK